MRLFLHLGLFIALMLSSGCLNLGAHRSARAVGKGNMEVGFSTSIPNWQGFYTNATAVGMPEGYLRYGISDRLDTTTAASSMGLTQHFDFALIQQDKFNLGAGLGLGVMSARVNPNLAQFEELTGTELPTVTAVGLVPDFQILASFGPAENEVTVGGKILALAGGVGVGIDGATGAGNTSGGVVMGGLILGYTHRGQRLIIHPEVDIFAGRYALDYGLLIMPSIGFSLAK